MNSLNFGKIKNLKKLQFILANKAMLGKHFVNTAGLETTKTSKK